MPQNYYVKAGGVFLTCYPKVVDTFKK